MAIQFEDYSAKIMASLDDACIAFLHEVAGEIEAQTKRNVPPGRTYYPQQKNAWTYKVDEAKGEATIGNPLESSLWTEFGTGEFALNGDGRKGYWIYVRDSSSGSIRNYSYKGGKKYSLEDAKKTVAMMREKGLDAHYTKGQTPKRPLQKAFTTLKPTIESRAKQVIGGKMS